ncbi:hypothetical protein [Burkholderia territorii]|uniref:hypothetical protein n=1 Tax=Burkholderia territorii TaxID=1503055 RepID=UPI0015824B72|nr:hypothetical protein [Burkholderia territorii]MBM2776778.1 hypothetical protein [Burkholderia territorii]
MMKIRDAVRSVAGGRKAQWYRNFVERRRNVVLNVASRTTAVIARAGRAVYAS